jgi:phage terminase large subunit
MYVAGLVVQAIDATGAARVKIDDIGLGGGVVDRLNELVREKQIRGVEIVGVNVGEGATETPVGGVGEFFAQDDVTTQDDRFLNLRSELNWKIRDRFIKGEIGLTMTEPEADDLLAQASQVKYLVTSRGKIQIEPKASMKKRTRGVSPDDWDALVLAFADLHARQPLVVMDDLMQWARRRA